MTWYIHSTQEALSGLDPERDAEGVLKNVASQTGLTFKTEKRKVRVLVVERGPLAK